MAESSMPQWRYRLGVGLFILHLILPLLALVFVPLLGLPSDISAVLFGLSVVGAPDVLLVAAAAVMGKEGLSQLLGKLGPWFKRLVAWDSVTRRRYKVGLWVLAAAVVVPAVVIYVWTDSIVDSAGQTSWGFYAIVASDIAFLVSFMILGAPWWDRIRALFTFDATIRFPHKTEANDPESEPDHS